MLPVMHIVVIQFDADKGLGLLEQPLLDLGCDVDVRLAPAEPLSLDGVDGLIVLGGLANPDDADPAVAVAQAACAEALARPIPVLGICLGAELLAVAAGAEAPRCQAEFGFHTVRLEPAAGDDPLLGDLPAAFPVFEAHGYTWEPPAGSTVLAHTALTRQAFHLPPMAWGIAVPLRGGRGDAAPPRRLGADRLGVRGARRRPRRVRRAIRRRHRRVGRRRDGDRPRLHRRDRQR